MTTPSCIVPGTRQTPSRPTGRVAVAAFLMGLDALLIPVVAAPALGFSLQFVGADAATWGWLLQTPASPGLVGLLAICSVVAAWLCYQAGRWPVVVAINLSLADLGPDR